MRLTRLLPLLAATLFGFAPAANAQFCAGFTDVAAIDGFCPNVEWVKNRSITLGCLSATTYCPNDVVVRSTMAAFLNRLGTALTPEILFVDLNSGPVSIQTTSTNYLCQSAPYVVTGFPRRAVAHGLFMGNVDAATTWAADLWYSTNAGASWSPMANFIPMQGVPGAGFTQATTFGRADLNVGSTYIFAIRIRESPVAPVGSTGNFTTSYCHLMVEIGNRNGTSTPFDTSAAPVSQGDANSNAD